MKSLKAENVEKCFNMLRQFIDKASTKDGREGAVLALNHLQKITAGADLPVPGPSAPMCVDTPRIDGGLTGG